MSEDQRKRGKVNRVNKQEILQREKNESFKDISRSYNEFKEFEGKKYTGMRVGGHHKWYYDKGEWDEKKIAPDKWEFKYAVTHIISRISYNALYDIVETRSSSI